MSDQSTSTNSPAALDELVSQLLSCGAVLSQIIGRMVQFEAAGRSAPDAAPIPDVAHSVIRGVLDDVAERHPDVEIRAAAAIVNEVTDAICEDIFFVP
jgi:hypothetical protein